MSEVAVGQKEQNFADRTKADRVAYCFALFRYPGATCGGIDAELC